MRDVEIVNLGLQFNGASYDIDEQGLTVHYGGPSPWGSGPDRSSAERFFHTASHHRCPTLVRGWHAYHLAQKWFGLAYNDVICPHGTIYRGRGPGQRSGANGSNIGNAVSPAICYLAGDGDPLTDQAKIAFHFEQGRYYCDLRWPHQHWTATSCPGDPLMDWHRRGYPLPASNPPALQTPRRSHPMIHFTNGIGTDEHVYVRPDGKLCSYWKQIDGTVSPVHVAIDAAFDSIGETLEVGRQRWFPAIGSIFGGVPLTVIYNPDAQGTPWSFHVTNVLHEFLSR